MTVRAMRLLLKGLPPGMDIVIATDDELIPVCDASGVEEIFDEEGENPIPVVMLFTCEHEELDENQDLKIDHEGINLN